MRHEFKFLVYFIFLCIGQGALADAYDIPKAVALENRKYTIVHDLTFAAGYLPIDSFNKSFTLNTSYLYNFKTYAGWEVINASLCSNQDTGLKSNLLNNFGALPTGFLDYYTSIVTTNFVYSPIYAKNLFFNEKVVNSETSFVGGGGMVGFNSGATAPLFGVGMINRYFLSDSTSLKLDARVYYHTASGKSSNMILMLSVGYSFNFGSVGK